MNHLTMSHMGLVATLDEEGGGMGFVSEAGGE
jgi:hypothetical protein